MILEPFHRGRLARTLVKLPIRAPLVPVVAFGIYWMVPLILLATHQMGTNDAWPTVRKLYLSDRTHLLYATLVSLGALPLLLVVRRTGGVVRHTLRLVSQEEHRVRWRLKYDRLLCHAYGVPIQALCAVASVLVLAALLARVHDTSYIAWWGNISHGYAGIAFAIVASLMVFGGLWSFIVVSAVSLVLSQTGGCKLNYQPLRADGCNGLRPVGYLIMLMWSYAIVVAGCIYVVFSRGYLRLESNPTIWFIGLAASICIPLVAVLPLLSITSSIRRARHLYLHGIEELARERRPPTTLGEAEELHKLLDLRKAIANGNLFPFGPQAIAIFSCLSVLQESASISELLSK